MTNPTANRSYDMPQSTDLVTNLPADFAIFGDAVDLDVVTDGGYQTVASAAGVTVLTKTSPRVTFITGATTQTITLPVVSTLALGQRFRIVNKSSGIVTVQSSGANTVYAVPAGATATFVCILITGTTAVSWDFFWDGSTTAPAAGGFSKIVAATFSATSAVNVNSCFSATYKRYKIILKYKGDAAAGYTTFIKFRVSGADLSANYYYTAASVGITGPTQVLIAGNNVATGFDLGAGSQTPNFNTAEIEVLHPFVNNTQCDVLFSVASLGQSTTAMQKYGAGSHNNTASGIIDGFSILFSGNSTGEYVVYGYAD